jgi:hypothetical protein
VRRRVKFRPNDGIGRQGNATVKRREASRLTKKVMRVTVPNGKSRGEHIFTYDGLIAGTLRIKGDTRHALWRWVFGRCADSGKVRGGREEVTDN